MAVEFRTEAAMIAEDYGDEGWEKCVTLKRPVLSQLTSAFISKLQKRWLKTVLRTDT